MTADRPLAARRFALVALAIPAALTAIAVAVQLVALPHVPDPVAVHWGASGAPDGFGPAWLSPVLTAVVGLGLPALLALTSLPGLRRGAHGATYRFMGSLAAGVSALMTVLLTWTFVMQAGLDDAADAPNVLVPLLVAYAAALAIGVVAWMLQPKAPWTPSPAGDRAAPLSLARDERVVWLSETSLRPAAVWLIVGACLLVVAAAIGAWVGGAPSGAALVLTFVALVLVVAAATTTAFHMRVDASGLAVTGVLGIPRFRVALADVVSVSVVDVDPVGEFGGWGLRLVPGRFGIVLRAGEAIEVERRGRRRLVVTADDAATGAALLTALRDRALAEGAATAEGSVR